jgi:predicted HNH restriction endonuclease
MATYLLTWNPTKWHLNDLAVMCANCHMLIHMNPKQALSVEELREMLGRYSED